MKAIDKSDVQELLDDFCQEQQLPESYHTIATDYFVPLAKEIAEARQARATSLPLFIGINGCQGSGKSTLSALLTSLLTNEHNLTVANLSIDDFYHTQQTRQQLARSIHPLFSTRGVPGTHDIELLQDTLHELSYSNKSNKKVTIPRFNKAIDDRHNKELWDVIPCPVDIIILEGWCIGASSQTEPELLKPVNVLESEEDKDSIWRKNINNIIQQDYVPLFEKMDQLIMLQAPNFDCVYKWRKKQEDKLRNQLIDKKTAQEKSTGVMDKVSLQRFIQHYQRLTEKMLATLPDKADVIFELNIDHQIIGRKDNATTHKHKNQ
ncbi:MAG: phosphoribulokinase [Cellvibrionaceae bacterium]